MKTPFSQFWKSRKDREEILEKQNEIKLTASQLSSLLFDGDVRGSLQTSRVVSLLPPVGTEVFRRLTPDALEQIKKCHKNKKVEEDYNLKPADELESGKPLPFFLGAPPPELRNVPLEDLDPFYQSQKTFVVVSKTNIVSRFNAASSCFSFSPFSLFRRASINILNHNLFFALMLVTLLINGIILVGLNPALATPRSSSECVFLSVYCLEAVLKIVSKGFCLGPFTYLRDSWDRLDFFIVVTGLFTVLLNIPELLFLMPLRLLKILGLCKESKRFMRSFGRSVKRLIDVLLVCLCVLSVFSVIGTQIFMGSLRQKCVRTLGSNLTSFQNETDDAEFNFESYIDDSANSYYRSRDLDALLCGNSSDSGICPEGYTCLRAGKNPNYGYTSFDSFGWSLLSTFRLMTRDFWENFAKLTMRANGKSTFIYFVLVLCVCSFSLFGLIVAMFTIIFTEQKEEEFKEVQQTQKDHSDILTALKDKCDEEPSPEKTEPERKCVSCLRVVCSCDCCGCWIKVKNGLQLFVLDPFFDVFIIICIILNVCFMAMEHYPMTDHFDMMLSLTGLVFVLIFLIEVVLKILALGVNGFFKVRWHIYDTALVVLSVIELGIADVEGLSFPILRLFRLCRWWPGFLKWLRLVQASLRSLWGLTLSVVLTAVFFSVFGMDFFGADYQERVCWISQDCALPRWHMSDFFHSFMLVTRALCGEWIETMWDCMEVSGVVPCVVFYMTLLFVGNFLVVTLFLSLLTKWISDKLSPEDEEKKQTLKKRINNALVLCGLIQRETEPSPIEERVALTCVTPETELKDCENGNQSSTLPITEHQTVQMVKEDEGSPEDCCCQKCYSCSPCGSLDPSQGCGRVWANIRKSCFKILQHKSFNNFIFFIILISTTALVFEDIYLDSRLALKVALRYIDLVITVVFLLEALFKWVGYGFKKYFTDGWCWLDFIVTLASVLSELAQMTGLDPSLQSLKALRPLRILPHIRGTRLSVVALLRLVPSLIDVLLVGLTVWLIFGVLGVQLFAGKFQYCFNETSEEYFLAEDVSNRSECLLLIEENYTEVRWKNVLINFDSIAISYLSLFQLATFKGWIDILYGATDSTVIEGVPVYENNINIYLYFIFFFLFGCFYTFTLLLKVIFEAYNAQRDQAGGTHLFLTQKQLISYNGKKHGIKRPIHIPRPSGKARGLVYDLVTRLGFEMVMLVVICVNVLLFMIEFDGMSSETEAVLMWIHFSLFLIFIIEFALKTFAFRRHYFRDNLNVIDFVAIVASILDMIMADMLERYIFSPYLLTLLRLARFSRVLHLIPGLRRIRLLYKSFIMSLPAVFNLTLVLFILILAYSSFGTYHFSHVKKAAMIDDFTNFETFWNSLICMLITTTWAGWDGLLYPMLLFPPDCDPHLEYPGTGVQGDCGNATLGIVFFVSYLCVSSYLVLMAFIVLVMEMLNAFAEMSQDPLSDHNLQLFFKTWSKFDPETSQFIQSSQLSDLCDKLKEPLRIVKPNSINMDLSVSPDNKLHCRDVLLAVAAQALGDAADKDALNITIDEKFPTFMPNSPFQESVQLNQKEAAMSVPDQQMVPDETEE